MKINETDNYVMAVFKTEYIPDYMSMDYPVFSLSMPHFSHIWNPVERLLM
jgi:hypothetical protein